MRSSACSSILVPLLIILCQIGNDCFAASDTSSFGRVVRVLDGDTIEVLHNARVGASISMVSTGLFLLV